MRERTLGPNVAGLVDVDQLRTEVRDKYREVAEDPTGDYHIHTGRQQALRLGYPKWPLSELPEEACEAFAGVGNPFVWGTPQRGDKVVDLGSGAGMDSFLSAYWVGPKGYVVGIDMTREMIERARTLAGKLGLTNVEFRAGFIEDLPVESEWADVVISNG
jgi:arsenite methyltransferase